MIILWKLVYGINKEGAYAFFPRIVKMGDHNGKYYKITVSFLNHQRETINV